MKFRKTNMALFYKVWNGGTRKWEGLIVFKGSKRERLGGVVQRSTKGKAQRGIKMKLREVYRTK
ncbi:hypothetical protein V1477_005707 [Vespula maculifrons]|uniref:Uncharacterized protein n=1 Tax=Vespula maculifrons TaxID=7453 RepID=A0ABD2CMT8_VESMC